MTKFTIVQVEELVSHYDELAKRKKTPPGAVYFVECQDFIKIGWCRLWNLYRCVHLDLQRGNPFRLKVLGFINFESVSVARKKENDLQTYFEHLRHRGEWFCKSKDLLDYIEVNSEDPDLFLEAGRKYIRLEEKKRRLKEA